MKINSFWRIFIHFIIDLIWFEFIHFCDIDLSLTHKRNYVIYIEWTIDNEIHLFMMSTTNLLILFCVRIEVRRVKKSQFNAIQMMLECCISEKVNRAEFSSTRQHFF